MLLFFSHRTDDHPAMKLWARSWMKPKVPEKPKPKPAPLVIPSLESSLSPTLDSSLSEFKDTLSIDGSLDPEASLTPHQTEQIAIIMAMSGDLEMATLANLALPCEVGLDSSASSMIDGSLLKEDQNLGDVEMGGLSSVGQGEVVDVGIGVLASAVGGMDVKKAPGLTTGNEAPTVVTPGMDAAPSAYNAGNAANIPKTPVIQKSRSEDFDPPTVKFVMSSGTERSPAKEPAIVDISDIPSTSAGPSQEQLEAAGMMRFQPLTHSGRREETRRPSSPLPQDESSLDTESSMEVDIEDAKPDRSKEVLISRTGEAETKEDVESMGALQEPESDPSASIKSESQTQLDTVPIKEPSITKSPVEGDTSVVPDPQVDDGLVVLRAKPEGNSHQSTASVTAPELVATNEQDDDGNRKEEAGPVNVQIASSETDQETEKDDGSAKPDIASVADGKAPEDMAMDTVSDVQSEGSEARVPTDHPNPTPDTMDVQKHTENVTTPDDVPQDTPPAEIQTVKDSLKEGQEDNVPADSGLESGIPSSTSSSVTPSAMEGIEPSMAANPDVALVPSTSLDQPHPNTSVRVDPGTVDTPVTSADPVNKDTAMTAAVDPEALVVPPTVGPAGDGQALVTPDVSVLGPVGMSGDAPPVPMEVENQPSTSSFTNQPIPSGVNLGGSGVWTPVKVGFGSAL